MSVLWPEHRLGTVPKYKNALTVYIFVIECSFLLVSCPMYFPRGHSITKHRGGGGGTGSKV